MDALQVIIERIRMQYVALQTAIAPILERAHAQQEAIRRTMEPLGQAMALADRVWEEVLVNLADRGWFITESFPVSLILPIYECIQTGEHSKIDIVMCQFVCEIVEKVESGLCQRFSHRRPILIDAFEAHRCGKHTLSIPVFFSQIDGIGREILGLSRQFFAHKARLAALQETLKALGTSDYLQNDIMYKTLAPLRGQLSIAADTDFRDLKQRSDPWFGPLNRHGVLHGVDTDYATEPKSLRCIALLGYLLFVDTILNKDLPSRNRAFQETWEKALSGSEAGENGQN